MKNYLDIINDEDKLFDMYEIIKINDDTFLIPDVYVNTSDIGSYDEPQIISTDIKQLIVNTGDTISLTLWKRLEEYIYIIQLDNVDNDTSGYITVRGSLFDDGRYYITCSMATLYKI